MKIKFIFFVLPLLTFLSNITTVKAQVDVNDSLALVDLYNNTNGPGWYSQNNWLTSAPVNTWYGVIVSENRVSNINLYSNNLSGSIPSSIGNLANLMLLNLEHNQLMSIPAEIGNLINLFYLHLDNNQLTSLPPETGNLINLIHLYLDNNQLTSLPAEIGGLINLSWLSLNNNQLTGVPAEIGNLTRLIFLFLNNNQLTGVPAEIGNLTNLGNLYLNNNQLTSLPAEIGNLTNLVNLYLNNNQLTSLPMEIGNLTNLTDLALNDNQLTSIPTETGNLTNLTELTLNNNQLTSIPTGIGNLTDLTYLYLHNNQLKSVPPEIADLFNLIGFYLYNNQLTFESLEPIVAKSEDLPIFIYSPQANIPIHQNGGSLSVSAGGTLSNNTYIWSMVGQQGDITISGDSVFSPSQHGDYYAGIFNRICKELALYTDTVHFGPLPVNIVNLKAQQEGSIITVEWTSLTEINVNNYEIQHSADSRSFTTVGILPARDVSGQVQYVYNDTKPANGDNFYRIMAIDKDGKLTYSNTVLVNILNDRNIILAYPNPAKNILNIQTNGSASFSLVNQNGKTIFTKTITNSTAIDVSRFAAGLYYLKNNNTGEVKKVVIAN